MEKFFTPPPLDTVIRNDFNEYYDFTYYSFDECKDFGFIDNKLRQYVDVPFHSFKAINNSSFTPIQALQHLQYSQCYDVKKLRRVPYLAFGTNFFQKITTAKIWTTADREWRHAHTEPS